MTKAPRAETPILNDVLPAVSAQPDTMVWRHNTGQAWQGKRLDLNVGDFVRVERGMVILAQARPIDFGLAGSGDIIGATGGRPLAVEVKTLTGRQADQQKKFEIAWRKVGGIYILARSADEALSKLDTVKLLG
jgi:hypothetical protein